MKIYVSNYVVKGNSTAHIDDPTLSWWPQRVERDFYIQVEMASYSEYGDGRFTLSWENDKGQICFIYGDIGDVYRVEALI